jgi:TonB family protein
MKLCPLAGFISTALLFISSVAWGQAEKQLPASDVERHIVKRVDPTYPQMASIAHIQGKVIVEITIAPDGSVVQARAVSGHPILVQAALDAVKRWKYEPFVENGAPVTVKSQVRVLFAMGPDAPLQQKYFLEGNACHDWLQMQRFESAYKLCNAALETAKELKPEGFGLRIDAYGNAGVAAYHLNRFPEALQDFQQRLKLAKKDLPPDRPEWFDVYHDLALTAQASGQLEQAESEYRETEKTLDTENKSLDRVRNLKEYGVRRQEEIRGQLRQTLTEHAGLLRQMGRNSEADDLEQRAKSLNASN